MTWAQSGQRLSNLLADSQKGNTARMLFRDELTATVSFDKVGAFGHP
jgi:hypothetical protein